MQQTMASTVSAILSRHASPEMRSLAEWLARKLDDANARAKIEMMPDRLLTRGEQLAYSDAIIYMLQLQEGRHEH